MANDEKMTQRDITLVNVLDRMGDKIGLLEERLEKLERLQSGLRDAMEYRKALQIDRSESAIERLSNDFLRYRSDMIRLAGDQDRTEKYMKDTAGYQKSIAAAQEGMSQNLDNLHERFKAQEKTAREHFEHSVRRGETFTKEIAALTSHISKLHMDSEKRVVEANRQTRQRLEELRLEVERRLLALDHIEDALKILLERTEPPEKKAFLPIRLCRRAIGAVRAGLTRFPRWLRGLFKRNGEGDD